MNRIAHVLAAGRIPAGEPAFEHVRAAYRLIGEACREDYARREGLRQNRHGDPDRYDHALGGYPRRAS